MRFAFFLGGFCGFAITAVAGFLAGRSADVVIRDAAIGCIVVAFLFRWFWSVVVKVFLETAHARRMAAAEKAAAERANQSANPSVSQT